MQQHAEDVMPKKPKDPQDGKSVTESKGEGLGTGQRHAPIFFDCRLIMAKQ